MKLTYTFQIEVDDIQSLDHAKAEIQYITDFYFKNSDDTIFYIEISGGYEDERTTTDIDWREREHLQKYIRKIDNM